jgi:Rad3-related DNA helicase
MTEQNASEAQGANEQVQGTASQAEETQGDSRASEHAEKLRELEKDNKKYRDRIRALENDQKKREDAEKTQAQRLAEERDSYKSRAAFLEDKVKRSNFIEQVGLPNPRAAWAVARDEGLEVEWDDEMRPTNLSKISKELQKIDPALFGSGSADGGAGRAVTATEGNGMNALIRGAAGR